MSLIFHHKFISSEEILAILNINTHSSPEINFEPLLYGFAPPLMWFPRLIQFTLPNLTLFLKTCLSLIEDLRTSSQPFFKAPHFFQIFETAVSWFFEINFEITISKYSLFLIFEILAFEILIFPHKNSFKWIVYVAQTKK